MALLPLFLVLFVIFSRRACLVEFVMNTGTPDPITNTEKRIRKRERLILLGVHGMWFLGPFHIIF